MQTGHVIGRGGCCFGCSDSRGTNLSAGCNLSIFSIHLLGMELSNSFYLGAVCYWFCRPLSSWHHHPNTSGQWAIPALNSPYVATVAEPAEMRASASQGARNWQEESLRCSLLMTFWRQFWFCCYFFETCSHTVWSHGLPAVHEV